MRNLRNKKIQEIPSVKKRFCSFAKPSVEHLYNRICNGNDVLRCWYGLCLIPERKQQARLYVYHCAYCSQENHRSNDESAWNHCHRFRNFYRPELRRKKIWPHQKHHEKSPSAWSRLGLRFLAADSPYRKISHSPYHRHHRPGYHKKCCFKP